MYEGQRCGESFIEERTFGLDFEGKVEHLDRGVCPVHEGREVRKARPQCYTTTGMANGRGCQCEQCPQGCAVRCLHGHMQNWGENFLPEKLKTERKWLKDNQNKTICCVECGWRIICTEMHRRRHIWNVIYQHNKVCKQVKWRIRSEIPKGPYYLWHFVNLNSYYKSRATVQ